MKCISVYTDNFELFSDIFEHVVESQSQLSENEEQEVEGVTFSHSGMLPSIIWSVCRRSLKWWSCAINHAG